MRECILDTCQIHINEYTCITNLMYISQSSGIVSSETHCLDGQTAVKQES